MIIWTLLGLLGTAPYAEAATLAVPGDHASVAEALDAADDGDTIEVSEGTWTLSESIDVDVTIVGVGIDATILQADGDTVLTGALVKLGLSTLTVDCRGQAGIEQVGGRVALEQVRLEDCDPAIDLEGYGGDATLSVSESSIEDGGVALALLDVDVTIEGLALDGLTAEADLIAGEGGSWTVSELTASGVDAGGAVLAVTAAEAFSAVRLEAGCSSVGEAVWSLDAGSIEVEAVLVSETELGADGAYLHLYDDATLRYATILGDGTGTAVHVEQAQVTASGIAVEDVAEGFHGVGSGAVSGTYNLVNADDVGAGAISDDEVLGSGSTEGSLDLYVWERDGSCDDQLAPSAESPLTDAGPPTDADWDGSVADIGGTGGPEGWIVVEDADGDGSSEVFDCDEADSGVYPGAYDVPGDGTDQDCDGADAELEDTDGDDPIGRWVPRSCNAMGTTIPSMGIIWLLAVGLRRRR